MTKAIGAFILGAIILLGCGVPKRFSPEPTLTADLVELTSSALVDTATVPTSQADLSTPGHEVSPVPSEPEHVAGAGLLAMVIDDGTSAMPRALLPLDCLSIPNTCPNQIEVLPSPVESTLLTRAVWSPNGEQLGFIAGASQESYDVYTMNVDGTGLKNLTASLEPEFHLAWSPTGQYLAFTRQRNPSDKLEVWLMDQDGSNARFLVNGSSPRWAPNGQTIVFIGSSTPGFSDVFRVDLQGKNLINLTNHPTQYNYGVFSPDGQQILFSAMRRDDQQTQEPHIGIFVASLDGSQMYELAPQLPNANDPTWSPDGSRVAFVSRSVDGISEVYVVNSDGTDLLNVSQSPTTNDNFPVWTPDGSILLFVSDRDQHSNIYAADPDRSEVTRLTNGRTGTEYLLPSVWP